jgi:hypothetical protein
MDITIEVMLPPRGAADYSESAHPKWRVLAVVDVHWPMRETDVIGMPRTGYVHVTGMPFPVTWATKTDDQIRKKLSEVFTREWTEGGEKREWAIAASASIPAAARNALRTQRQITVTWTQLRAFLRNLRRDAPLDDLDLN